MDQLISYRSFLLFFFFRTAARILLAIKQSAAKGITDIPEVTRPNAKLTMVAVKPTRSPIRRVAFPLRLKSRKEAMKPPASMVATGIIV